MGTEHYIRSYSISRKIKKNRRVANKYVTENERVTENRRCLVGCRGTSGLLSRDVRWEGNRKTKKGR